MNRIWEFLPSVHVIIPLKYTRTGIPEDQRTWSQNNSAGLKRDCSDYIRSEPCFLQLTFNYI